MTPSNPHGAAVNVSGSVLGRFRKMVRNSRPEELRDLLIEHPELRDAVDAPLFSFDRPAIVRAAAAGSVPTLEVLLDFGADIDQLSSWEAGGFGVLHSTCFDHPEVARWLVERGATIDVHAAAGLPDHSRLRALLTAAPNSLHQRGPDGQLPLHFAADVTTAKWLLEQGAELDARCIDHDSTAAQWAIARAPEISRLLLDRGAEVDIFLAVALEEEDLVRRLIAEDPSCLRARLGRPGYAPVIPGNILDWNLGWWAEGGQASPHRIARAKGNEGIYQLLLDHSPPDVRFLVAAWQGDEAAAQRELAEAPGLVSRLPAEDRRFLADAAWDGNAAAVEILLQAGFDPHVRGEHQSTPLDRAAFHGFADIVALLLAHDPSPPLEERNEFGGRPLGALLYGCQHGWRTDGDAVATARLLAEAGASVEDALLVEAPEEVAAVLRPFLRAES